MTTTVPEARGLPPALADIVGEFHAVSQAERLQLLLEFSKGLPPLPPHLAGHPDLLEQVDECQSPVFLNVELDSDQVVHVHFQAPAEAPTTRGFAGILKEGLEGLTASEVLAVPDDVCGRLGLAEAVSPLRLRGMLGMLARIKRQVRARTAAAR